MGKGQGREGEGLCFSAPSDVPIPTTCSTALVPSAYYSSSAYSPGSHGATTSNKESHKTL